MEKFNLELIDMVDHLLDKEGDEYDFHKINRLMRKELKEIGVIIKDNNEYELVQIENDKKKQSNR